MISGTMMKSITCKSHVIPCTMMSCSVKRGCGSEDHTDQVGTPCDVPGSCNFCLRRLWFSEIEAKFIKNKLRCYKRNIAINTKIVITATVPHRTNLVKLFQVFLWFSLSINYFCLALNFGFVLLMT